MVSGIYGLVDDFIEFLAESSRINPWSATGRISIHSAWDEPPGRHRAQLSYGHAVPSYDHDLASLCLTKNRSGIIAQFARLIQSM